MASRKTKFKKKQWFELSLHPSFDWLRKGQDIYHAFCDVCNKSFALHKMGIKAVVSHSKGKLHNKLVKMRASYTSLQTFSSPNTTEVETQAASFCGFSALDIADTRERIRQWHVNRVKMTSEARLDVLKKLLFKLNGPYYPSYNKEEPSSFESTCEICGVTRNYRPCGITHFYGIETCFPCRRFITLITENYAYLDELQCISKNGVCKIVLDLSEKYLNPETFSNRRCMACWLKQCLRFCHIPCHFILGLNQLLPAFMRFTVLGDGNSRKKVDHVMTARQPSSLKAGWDCASSNSNNNVTCADDETVAGAKLKRAQLFVDLSKDNILFVRSKLRGELTAASNVKHKTSMLTNDSEAPIITESGNINSKLTQKKIKTKRKHAQCGVCLAIFIYANLTNVTKFGIFCCISCREFLVTKIRYINRIEASSCNESNGKCRIGFRWNAKKKRIGAMGITKRCVACWLKKCILRCKLPQGLHVRLNKSLPLYMRIPDPELQALMNNVEYMLTPKLSQTRPVRYSPRKVGEKNENGSDTQAADILKETADIPKETVASDKTAKTRSAQKEDISQMPQLDNKITETEPIPKIFNCRVCRENVHFYNDYNLLQFGILSCISCQQFIMTMIRYVKQIVAVVCKGYHGKCMNFGTVSLRCRYINIAKRCHACWLYKCMDNYILPEHLIYELNRLLPEFKRYRGIKLQTLAEKMKNFSIASPPTFKGFCDSDIAKSVERIWPTKTFNRAEDGSDKLMKAFPVTDEQPRLPSSIRIKKGQSPGAVLCGVCRGTRFYRFVKQAHKFGINTCESCRKFVAKMIRSSQHSIGNCRQENGKCRITPVESSKAFCGLKKEEIIIEIRRRCPACWLKLCLNMFTSMPEALHLKLKEMLPSYMRADIKMPTKPVQAKPSYGCVTKNTFRRDREIIDKERTRRKRVNLVQEEVRRAADIHFVDLNNFDDVSTDDDCERLVDPLSDYEIKTENLDDGYEVTVQPFMPTPFMDKEIKTEENWENNHAIETNEMNNIIISNVTSVSSTEFTSVPSEKDNLIISDMTSVPASSRR